MLIKPPNGKSNMPFAKLCVKLRIPKLLGDMTVQNRRDSSDAQLYQIMYTHSHIPLHYINVTFSRTNKLKCSNCGLDVGMVTSQLQIWSTPV